MLQGSSFEDPDEPDEFFSALQGILRGIDPETLDAVSQEGMIRLQTGIDGNGEYVE
jgi:hypothetical protein